MTLSDCLVELHGVEKILSFPFDGLVVKTTELTNSVGLVTFVIICDASILCSYCFNRSRGVNVWPYVVAKLKSTLSMKETNAMKYIRLLTKHITLTIGYNLIIKECEIPYRSDLP